MYVTHRLVEYTSLGTILITTLAGVVVSPQLPDQMAIHFSATATPDTFVTKELGITLLPAIMLFVLVFLHWMPQLDPSANIHVLNVTTVGTMLLLAVVHGVVLAHNLGYNIPFDLLLAGILAWAVVISGYAFYKERM